MKHSTRWRTSVPSFPGSDKWNVILVTVLLLLGASQSFARAKTDKITFDNGDHITCEIKTLQQGQLTVKTNYSRTMQLDWRAIKRIVSSQYYQLVLVDGRRVYGTLVDSGEDGVVAVKLLDRVKKLPVQEIMTLAPLQQKFFQRLSGSVNIGASALKSNSERTLNIGSNTSYRSRNWFATGSFSWYSSTRKDSPRTNQANISATSYRLFGSRWAMVSTASFAKNDELDLRLRSSLAIGAGYRLLETSNKFFLVMAGLNATKENYYGDTSGNSANLEGDVSAVYNSFIFRKPQVTFNVILNIYPSINVSGRYRAALTSYLNYEVISNFFVGFNASYSYDNKPPSATASTSDWKLTMSVGYTFSP